MVQSFGVTSHRFHGRSPAQRGIATRRVWSGVAALLGVASLAGPPQAAAQVFTDQASWEANAGRPRLVEDFESAPLGAL